jgi:hypothetical protein
MGISLLSEFKSITIHIDSGCYLKVGTLLDFLPDTKYNYSIGMSFGLFISNLGEFISYSYVYYRKYINAYFLCCYRNKASRDLESVMWK